MRIYLIGFMGSGKTSIGKLLAENFHLPFVDTDSYISACKHKSIQDIFQEEGEHAFRLMEQEALQTLSQKYSQAIISTGGGLPCYQNNMDFILKDGVSIYLEVPLPELHRRLLTEQSTRPLLANKNPQELFCFIQQSLANRLPYYTQANLILPGETKHLNELIKRIQPFLNK